MNKAVKGIVFSITVLLAACSNSDSILSEISCRDYASEYMADNGITTSCDFDEAQTTLFCSDDAGNTTTTVYDSVERFIEEARHVGLITAAERITNSTISYEYENNLLVRGFVNVNDDTIIEVIYDQHDNFRRPLIAMYEKHVFPECQGELVNFEFNDNDRTVSLTFPFSDVLGCSGFNVQTYDDNTNITQLNLSGSIISYDIISTERVCL